MSEQLRPQVFVAQPNVPHIWEEEPTQVGGHGEKMVDKNEEWKSWLNFDVAPDQKS
jgi:hypothetical protein